MAQSLVYGEMGFGIEALCVLTWTRGVRAASGRRFVQAVESERSMVAVAWIHKHYRLLPSSHKLPSY